MIRDKCALIITSSVHVSAPYTHLRDPAQREAQYLDAIGFYVRDSPLRRIIVCDNTGYDYPKSLETLARSCNKEIELLSFQGNSALIAEYGKGYGEGEILEFVLARSTLIAEAEGFLKITGRLKVVNIARVWGRMDHRKNYFMPIALIRPRFLVPRGARRCVEVRVYYTTKTYFNEVLLTAYKGVRDNQVHFLEHAYYEAMAKYHKLKAVSRFPIAPEITGISGSNGWVFRERSWLKQQLVRLFSRKITFR